jgi:hypothetical protein
MEETGSLWCSRFLDGHCKQRFALSPVITALRPDCPCRSCETLAVLSAFYCSQSLIGWKRSLNNLGIRFGPFASEGEPQRSSQRLARDWRSRHVTTREAGKQLRSGRPSRRMVSSARPYRRSSSRFDYNRVGHDGDRPEWRRAGAI